MGSEGFGHNSEQIILRASAYPSSKPLPFLASFPNKESLLKICFNSLLKANINNIPITVINDGIENPERIFPNTTIITAKEAGNVQTFHQQLDEASKYDAVLLVEDDYLWRPETLPDLFTAIEVLPYVSPYDHPGHYLEERFNTPKKLKLIDGFVYRECPSNTLTFACKGNFLRENLSKFKGWGIRDHEMWQDIGNLWCPIPSFATHLVAGLLAPNVSWESYLQTSI